MTTEFLMRAVELSRATMYPEHVGINSCISMSRFMCEVLGYFGVEAQAKHVSLLVLNKVAADALAAGVFKLDEPFPKDLEDAGGWTVGIGTPKEGEHVVGHVAVIAGDKLIDASLDQASRPHKDIELEAAVMDYNPEHNNQVYQTPEGVLLVYKVHDEYPEFVTKFKDSPDWRMFKQRYGKVVGQVIKQLKAEKETGFA